MKRTPVLIDVNGVPLRESLSYNGGGAGFGGQMAEWVATGRRVPMRPCCPRCVWGMPGQMIWCAITE